MPHTPFTGRIPDDRLYCRKYDMWVKTDGEELLIGATAFGLFLAGELIAFTAKPKGAEILVGRGMGTVESRKTVVAVHAPVSFFLLAGNDEAEERPALINRDPYGAGWMARGRPLAWAAEWIGLCDATTYRAHVLSIEPEARFDE